MVRVGPYTVRIVEAASKAPFAEHEAADGSTYVEVEPDAEYYVAVSAENGKSETWEAVVARVLIDGCDLRRWESMKRTSSANPHLVGLVSFHDGKRIKTALRFSKVSRASVGGTTAPWTGTVKVEFRKRIETGVKPQQAVSSNWKGGEVVATAGKKGVKSVKGDNFEARPATLGKPTRHYRGGAVLQSIELKYSSTPGLIMAGILGRSQQRVDGKDGDDDKEGEEVEVGYNDIPEGTKRGRREALATRGNENPVVVDLTGFPCEEEPPKKKRGTLDLSAPKNEDGPSDLDSDSDKESLAKSDDEDDY